MSCYLYADIEETGYASTNYTISLAVGRLYNGFVYLKKKGIYFLILHWALASFQGTQSPWEVEICNGSNSEPNGSVLYCKSILSSTEGQNKRTSAKVPNTSSAFNVINKQLTPCSLPDTLLRFSMRNCTLPELSISLSGQIVSLSLTQSSRPLLPSLAYRPRQTRHKFV